MKNNNEKLKRLSEKYNYDFEDVKNVFYLTGNFYATEKFIKKIKDMKIDLHKILNPMTVDDFNYNKNIMNEISHKEKIKMFLRLFFLASTMISFTILLRAF